MRQGWVENGYTAGYTLFHGQGEIGVPSLHISNQKEEHKFWGRFSQLVLTKKPEIHDITEFLLMIEV